MITSILDRPVTEMAAHQVQLDTNIPMNRSEMTLILAVTLSISEYYCQRCSRPIYGMNRSKVIPCEINKVLITI